MKKGLLIISLCVFSLALFAQSGEDYIELTRSVLKTEKKAAIAETMELTSAESEVFWPLYNEFTEKAYTIQSKRVKIIKDFGENYETLSDEKADEIMTSYMSFKEEILKLNKAYYKKFKKILPAGKVAKYFHAENKIAAVIDFQLASEIPFIETK